MSKSYPLEFKEKIVSKLLHPDGGSIVELATETGLSRTTLYQWLKLYKNNASNIQDNNMSSSNKKIKQKYWSAKDKLNAIIVTANMTEQQVGFYCRKEGVYAEDLAQWSQDLINSSSASIVREKQLEMMKYKSKIKSLEKELIRKDKALAEASALLILKKKAELIWGETKEDQ